MISLLTQKLRVEDVVNARAVLASTARAQYNEYLYQQVVALADLERITGGAFNPGLADATVPRAALPRGDKDAK